MDIKDFRAGIFIPEYNYKSFFPEPINHEWEISDAQVNYLLSNANIKLGELNAFSQLIPNIDFFIMMHVVKEADASSRIEGTQTNIEENLQKNSEYIDPEKKDDWQEVQNYIHAMNHAIGGLGSLPLSSRLFLEAHKILLQGMRGTHKQPGEFRRSQNWIGGASINDAVFIPPHYEALTGLLSDLDNFLNNENLLAPELVKIAIAHYQFETIHPFLDGNGRVGRLLITLYLVKKGLLMKPTLYLSNFFEKNKTLYYDNLTRVRISNDLTQWIRFFLEGVRQTAENSIETFKSIIKLREECETKIFTLGKRATIAKEFLNYLYKNPISEISTITESLKIGRTTTSRLVQDFIRMEILEKLPQHKRMQQFGFKKYIDLFR